jgi:hypothetical protein
MLGGVATDDHADSPAAFGDTDRRSATGDGTDMVDQTFLREKDGDRQGFEDPRDRGS